MLAMIVLIVVAALVLGFGVRLLEPRMAFFPFAGEDVTPRRYGVAFEGFTLDTADGERLRAWHLPRADAIAHVVYFHGNGGNLSIWTDVLVGLWHQRLDVVAVDYRGYGLSTGTPTEHGLYRDVDATIGHVATALRGADLPILYWGRSLGTAMAA
jgi:pimeloyl-ACP methyl ester carboxylesterase